MNPVCSNVGFLLPTTGNWIVFNEFSGADIIICINLPKNGGTGVTVIYLMI